MHTLSSLLPPPRVQLLLRCRVCMHAADSIFFFFCVAVFGSRFDERPAENCEDACGAGRWEAEKS